MNDNRKIAYLRFFSIAVVLLLGGIQFYLVYNSYHLTQEQYAKEITAKIDTFQKDSTVIRSKRILLSSILKIADNYADGKLGKDEFLKKLFQSVKDQKYSDDSLWTVFAGKRRQLQQVNYAETYDWIVLHGRLATDSLLSRKEAPLILLGKLSIVKGGWLISKSQNKTEVLVNKSLSAGDAKTPVIKLISLLPGTLTAHPGKKY